MTFLTGNLPLSESQLRDFSKALPRSLSASQEEELSKDCPLLLDKLVDTAYDPSIGLGHRGVAINALCSLVGRATSLGFQNPWSRDRWFKSFYVVLDRSDSTKSKPVRQLLGCLFSSLSSFDGAENLQIIERVVETVLEILLQQSDRIKAKPALHILTYLLSKDIIAVPALIQQFEIATQRLAFPASCASSSDTERLQWLLRILFDWVGIQDTSIAAGQTACAVIKKVLNDKDYESDSNDPIWATPLAQILRENVDELNNYRSHLLPELFKSRVSHYLRFLTLLGLGDVFAAQNEAKEINTASELDIRLLFVCLEIGKETGTVIDSATPEMKVVDDVIYIPDTMLAQVVEDATDSVRLSGLALLISSVSITRPFTPQALQCLKRNLPHLLMETDVYVRGEVLVLIRRLVDRFKAALGPLSKAMERGVNGNLQKKPSNQGLLSATTASCVLEQHRKFLSSFLNLVKAQLHPAAPYQRHVSGLRSLIILAKSGLDGRIAEFRLSKQAQAKEAARWPFHEPIFNPALTRMLQDLLMDPFEDVRSFAASLLVMQSDITEASVGGAYTEFLKKAEHAMLLSGRADHADGVSRANAIVFETAHGLAFCAAGSKLSKESQMESLISRLENRISLAKDNMALAVDKFPFYEVLASLRLILEEPDFYANIKGDMLPTWLAFHDRLVVVLEAVWHCVKGVLCNDAPEGFVPDEMEGDINITTKDILSYCWRALKESSSLLRVLVSRVPIDGSDRSLVSQVQFDALCKLAFTELVELRHRGAFSAVAQAFAACCARANALNRNTLLHSLYGDTLSAIKAKGSATTRRSAGLPSLMVGILTACPETPLFRQAIDDLLREASVATQGGVIHGDPLPQVHALNCLRAMFLNAVLGPYTEPHIATCLSLAGSCLTSEIWAIRNCGLMLFRALIDRLLGSADSQNWSEEESELAKPRFSYTDFPGLLEMILKLLTPDATRLSSAQSALESVFPALKLIQRMTPPPERRSEVRELVLRLCQSPHWHVRDMAARTYASLVPGDQRCHTAEELVPRATSGQNLTHGRLLCISYLVKLELWAPQSKATTIDELEASLQSAFDDLSSANQCPFTKSLYMDILNIFSLDRLKKGRNDFSRIQAPSLTNITQAFEATPAVQKSFALHVLLQYSLQPTESNGGSNDVFPVDEPNLLEYLQLLQTVDPRICLQTIEPIIEIATSIPASSLHMIAEHLSLSAIYDDNQDPHVLSFNRLLLFKLYEALGQDGCVLHEPLQPEDMRRTLSSEPNLPPSLVESTVMLWGPLMNEACTGKSLKDTLPDELSFLAASLRTLIDEQQPFDLRIAVAHCLANISNLWKPQTSAQSAVRLHKVQLKFILLVYDLLNDDDDEIRDIATKVASLILSGGGTSANVKDTVPLLASQRLIYHLSTHYSHLPDLCEQAILRLTAMDQQHSAKSAFEVAGAENTTLFMVEKQNLFIDPVREAILWSQCLKCVSDVEQLPRELIPRFLVWAREGLSLLHEKVQAQDDGVLGWTSKPDMFIFGMRVWCAVDVVLTWRRRFLRKSVTMSKAVVELGHILASGIQREVHPMWLAKVEKILVKEIRETFKDSVAGRNVIAAGAALRDPAR